MQIDYKFISKDQKCIQIQSIKRSNAPFHMNEIIPVTYRDRVAGWRMIKECFPEVNAKEYNLEDLRVYPLEYHNSFYSEFCYVSSAQYSFVKID